MKPSSRERSFWRKQVALIRSSLMKKRLLLSLFCIAIVVSFSTKSVAIEQRCGWLYNPTPSNWFLTDRDGVWTIGIQGGYQASGMEAIPDLSPAEYVETNGYYGYACACLEVTTNPQTRQITRIYQGRQQPLATCREDPALPSVPRI